MNYPGTYFSLAFLEQRDDSPISDRISILKDLIIQKDVFCASSALYLLDKLLYEAEQKDLKMALRLIGYLSLKARQKMLICSKAKDCAQWHLP